MTRLGNYSDYELSSLTNIINNIGPINPQMAPSSSDIQHLHISLR